MRPRQLTALLTFGAAVLVALCAGISIATENYALLIFGATAVIVGVLVVVPGYVPLFTFGLLMPFSLPVPYVFGFPFLLLAMTVCGVKYWLQHGLQYRKLPRYTTQYKSADLSVMLYFVGAFLRYCLKPSLPNVMGWGTNVTGFRSWLGYVVCFGVVLLTSRFIGTREGLSKMMKWLAYVSVFFILMFVPVVVSKSQAMANFFYQLGMFVSAFDNGMLRFVALPEFGLFLLSLALLPNLLHLKRKGRALFFVLGTSAVLLGGSRSGLAMALIVLVTIPLLRRRVVQSAIAFASLSTIAAVGYFAGPALSELPHTGFLRAFGLVSPQLSEVTGGDVNMEWREVRWQRGLEEIRKHPLIGVGYGGLENAFSSDYQTEEQTEDVSLMTGGVHNGYIAGALALGIPMAALFVYILFRNIFINAFLAYRLHNKDPELAEAHCFLCANLLAIAAGMFFGSDLNDPLVWFFIACAMFVRQLRPREVKKAAALPVFVQPELAGQVA